MPKEYLVAKMADMLKSWWSGGAEEKEKKEEEEEEEGQDHSENWAAGIGGRLVPCSLM